MSTTAIHSGRDLLSAVWSRESLGDLILCVGSRLKFAMKRKNFPVLSIHTSDHAILTGERNVEERILLEFCDEKELCVANTWFEKKEKRKITCSISMIINETEVDKGIG